MLFAQLLQYVLYTALSIPLHFFFFFTDTATTEIYTLSLHDALPICTGTVNMTGDVITTYNADVTVGYAGTGRDRKSTRLNSSHANISYAVFCLKKKKKKKKTTKIKQTNEIKTKTPQQS